MYLISQSILIHVRYVRIYSIPMEIPLVQGFCQLNLYLVTVCQIHIALFDTGGLDGEKTIFVGSEVPYLFFLKITPILIATSSKLDMVIYTMAMWHRVTLGSPFSGIIFARPRWGTR